jgi:hypothetical protein
MVASACLLRLISIIQNADRLAHCTFPLILKRHLSAALPFQRAYKSNVSPSPVTETLTQAWLEYKGMLKQE